MSRRALALLGLVPFGLVRFRDVLRLERIHAGLETTEETEALVTVVFEGIVFDPRGAPAQGASVVSSAGGHALTDRSGKYRLEVQVPAQARSVEVTVMGGAKNEHVATRSSRLAGASDAVESSVIWLQPIELPEGSTCQPSWLPTFGGDLSPDGTLFDLKVYDDGSGPALYAAGENGHIWKGNGTRWLELDTQMGQFDRVWALAVFDDGSGPALYAGGHFESAGGVEVNNLAKWDGSSWTALGSGVDGAPYPWSPIVQDLAVFDDGDGPALYAAGQFLNAGGVSVGSIAKWDGTSWTALGSGIGWAFNNSTVNTLEVFDDGSGEALYAGGGFSFAGGIPASRIAKWNGSSWSSLANGISGGTGTVVSDLTVFDEGSGPALYVGGIFSSAGGAAANSFAKWDGAVWSSLTSPVNSRVLVLGVFDDGSGPALYGAGSFPDPGGSQADRIARWNGSSWDVLADVDGGIVYLNAFAEFDAGGGSTLYIGGNFDTVGGNPARSVAKWDGSSWSSVAHGLTDWVEALAVLDDGEGPALYAGGPFDFSATPNPDERVARWNGSSWATVGEMNDDVDALAVFDPGSGPALFAAGNFLTAGGVSANRIARWDGSSWNPLGNGLNNSATTLTVFDDGSGPALYAGGLFSTAGGGAANRVARWDGIGWSSLGSGVGPGGGAWVRALAVHDDGNGPKLYAGGTFTTAGGQPANRIACWNGSTWSPLGSGMDDDVFALAVFDDGNGAALHAAGQFQAAGGVAASRIAKWNGTSWEPLGLGLSGGAFTKMSMVVHDDGTGPALYVGGGFTMAGGAAANRIARWNGTNWSPLGPGIAGTGSTFALAAFNDRTGTALHAGGSFFQNSAGDNYLAKWGCPDTSAPVINCPETVVVQDLVGPPGELVNLQVTVEDAEDYRPDVVFTPPSGSFFPRGTTLVTCTANDASGNQAVCQFQVIVVESDFRVIRPQPR